MIPSSIALIGNVDNNISSDIYDDIPDSLSTSCWHGDYRYSWWSESNGQPYLNIIASDHYQLGLEFGEQNIAKIYHLDAVIKMMALQYEIPIETMYYLSSLYEIPEDYAQYLQGVTDSTGLTYSEILLEVTLFDLFYGYLMPSMMQGAMGCTAIADSNTIGQNIDLTEMLFPSMGWLRYKVGRKYTTFCAYGGVGFFPTGKNSKDVSVTVNLVQQINIGEFGIPIPIKAMMGFENLKKSSDFVEMFTESYTCGWNFLIVNQRNKESYGMETLPFETYTVPIDTYQVRTNTFMHEPFRPYLIDPLYSMDRQLKAEELSQAQYQDGDLSMCDILNTLRYNDGEVEISRLPIGDPMHTMTVAFFVSSKHFCFFGLGNPLQNNIGLLFM